LKVIQLTSVSTVFEWPRPNRASANADARFGVINNQQRSLSTTIHDIHDIHDTLHHCPRVPTVPNRHRSSRPPSTAYSHGRQPPRAQPTATWQRHVTSRNDHPNDKERPTTNTNNPTARKRRPAPRNGHKRQRAGVRQITSPPFILLTANPGATSPSATWQPDDERRITFVVRRLR
jgi:hypothetical protein